MAEALVLDQSKKFWAEDCIGKVSQNKVTGGETFRNWYLRLVDYVFGQKGMILGLERDNKELSERGRDFAGQVDVLTFQVEMRNEILAVSPENLDGYIARLGEELGELQGTDVPEEEADARERQAGIDKLRVKLELAQGYQKIIGPFVEELIETAAERGTEELEAARKHFGEIEEELQQEIAALKRDGLPAHTDEIQRLTLALHEKTEAFNELERVHQALVVSAGEAEEQLGTQVELLRGQVEGARAAQVVAERALEESQRANGELKVEHARVLQLAAEEADERAEELQRLLDEAREANVQFADRVRVLEAAPEADVQLKADMLDRVAVVVLGGAPDYGLLEARVGEHMQAEGRLAQLYQFAKLPADSFVALSNVIQALGRIFVAFGYGAEQNYETSSGQHEGNVAEINRKAGEYDNVVLAHDNAVRDLGAEQLERVREQAESKKLLSILGNGISWTWNATTVVPSYIYDAMRF